jgi:hypothetical protein
LNRRIGKTSSAVAKLHLARVLLRLQARAKVALAIRVEGRWCTLVPLFMRGLGVQVTPNHEEIGAVAADSIERSLAQV